jgi:hypothetical protein
MTVLNGVRRTAAGAWQSVGFALSYPWFRLFETRASNHEYRGNGEFIDIERHRDTDYEMGEIAGLLSVLPAFGYLSALCSLAVLEASLWAVLAVALCVCACIRVMGEVTVTTLTGDGR